MKRFFPFLIVFLIQFNLSLANDISDKAGTSGFSFLKNGVGARPAGLGNAYTSISGDVNSLFWNPGGLAFLEGAQVSFIHHQWFQDITTEYVAAGFGLKKNTFGLSFSINRVPDIELRDEYPSSEPLGTFDAHDVVLSFTWARKIKERLGWGVSFKTLYEKIHMSSASGIGFDLGGVFSFTPNWSVGAAILNLGPKMKFDQEKFHLPTQYKLGVSYLKKSEYLKGGLLLTLDLVKPRDNDMKVHFGGEYSFQQGFGLRAGYLFGYDDKNLSFGFGLNVRKYVLDYAFVPYDSDLGEVHRISLTLKM